MGESNSINVMPEMVEVASINVMPDNVEVVEIVVVIVDVKWIISIPGSDGLALGLSDADGDIEGDSDGDSETDGVDRTSRTIISSMMKTSLTVISSTI